MSACVHGTARWMETFYPPTLSLIVDSSVSNEKNNAAAKTEGFRSARLMQGLFRLGLGLARRAVARCHGRCAGKGEKRGCKGDMIQPA